MFRGMPLHIYEKPENLEIILGGAIELTPLYYVAM